MIHEFRDTIVHSATEPVRNFDLDAYMGKWYAQGQEETSYLPKEKNYLTQADYTRISKSKFKVYNYARDSSIHGKGRGVELLGEKYRLF